jgi:uncharacterized protein YqgQ
MCKYSKQYKLTKFNIVILFLKCCAWAEFIEHEVENIYLSFIIQYTVLNL